MEKGNFKKYYQFFIIDNTFSKLINQRDFNPFFIKKKSLGKAFYKLKTNIKINDLLQTQNISLGIE